MTKTFYGSLLVTLPATSPRAPPTSGRFGNFGTSGNFGIGNSGIGGSPNEGTFGILGNPRFLCLGFSFNCFFVNEGRDGNFGNDIFGILGNFGISGNSGNSVGIDETIPPAAPVTITNITVGMIDNMFIVNPPAEVQQAVEQQQTENDSNNILSADFLEFNDLEQDYLEENELEYTELDRDLLDVDFLQDLLEIIEEADLLDRKKSSGGFDSVNITGTVPGFDKDTQYQTIVEDTGQIWFYRQVTGIISIRLSDQANATINTITDEKESLITVGDGESINIIIRQTE